MILHQQMERKNHLVSCSHAEWSRAIEEYVWVNYEQTVNVKTNVLMENKFCVYLLLIYTIRVIQTTAWLCDIAFNNIGVANIKG